MEKNTNYTQKMMWVLKSLSFAYLATAVLLSIFAVLAYRLDLQENVKNIISLVIYVLSNLVGGFVVGKCTKQKRYLWGVLVGVLYFSLLILITLGVHRTISDGNVVTVMILCICSGTIGGMIS